MRFRANYGKDCIIIYVYVRKEGWGARPMRLVPKLHMLTRLIIKRQLYFTFNPFMPNGISQFYQLEQSFSVLRVVGWYFSFLLIF